MSTQPIDHDDGRLGVPEDRMGMHATPLRQADGRIGVLIMVIPPLQLRDAPRSVVEDYVGIHKKSILASIANEIYTSYTSDPLDGASARNTAESLIKHADSLIPNRNR